MRPQTLQAEFYRAFVKFTRRNKGEPGRLLRFAVILNNYSTLSAWASARSLADPPVLHTLTSILEIPYFLLQTLAGNLKTS
jgi:hypothetical protein